MSFALRVIACAALLAFAQRRRPALRGAGRQRYDCKQSDPCSLEDAINGASANDEVIVLAGDHTISGAPINVVYGGLQIHGDPGGADAAGHRGRSEGCRRST